MLATPAITPDNLRRLLALRGISLLAAAAISLLAKPLLSISPDIEVLLVICGIWAVFGIATWVRTALPKARLYPVRTVEVLLHLGVDIALLTAFLAFCGGVANPLTALYLMPVAAAAAVLPFSIAWIVAAAAIAAYALLWEIAIPITVEDMDAAMQMHLVGMWLTFGLSAALLVGIVARMSAALRERDRHLAAARERSLRDERILAMGSLAAGAAHQLGTPLNTATLLIDEITANALVGSDMARDAHEVRDQIDHCAAIVKALVAEVSGRQADVAISISAWVLSIVTNFKHRRGDCNPEINMDTGFGEHLLHPETTLAQSLADLLDNAADSSPEKVSLTVEPDGDAAIFAIRDAGNGFSATALSNIGRQPWTDKVHGLGLGLYLANATAERMGGTLTCRNTSSGAEVVMRLPLSTIGLQP